MNKIHKSIKLPTKYGRFDVIGLTSNGITHFCLCMNEKKNELAKLVRIQSACRFGEVFQSLDCDCGPQLWKSMELISAEKSGLIIYLEQEGRGAGIETKIDAMYLEQSESIDTVQAFHKLGVSPDTRDYSIALEMLRFLGIDSIRLLTNNPRKVDAINKGGILVERQSLLIDPTEFSKQYMLTKQLKLGHLLNLSKE